MQRRDFLKTIAIVSIGTAAGLSLGTHRFIEGRLYLATPKGWVFCTHQAYEASKQKRVGVWDGTRMVTDGPVFATVALSPL